MTTLHQPAARGPAPVTASAFRDDVLRGLSVRPRALPCKYLYDRRGSDLFERITRLPEYYLTRTELRIMRQWTGNMAQAIGPHAMLVEPGSGSSIKTRLLLECLPEPAGYVPIDISRECLINATRTLATQYPHIPIHPLCADYGHSFALPAACRRDPMRRIALYFPGSTIGNFDPPAAQAFLTRMAALAGPGGGLLIGVDMRKSPDILLPAYDDAAGVTAAFNANILVRINHELGGDFQLHRYAHRVRWDGLRGRVEMHLDALEDHVVHVAGHRFSMMQGETIHTESSYKWTPHAFIALAGNAGWLHRRTWTDEHEWFAVMWMERS